MEADPTVFQQVKDWAGLFGTGLAALALFLNYLQHEWKKGSRAEEKLTELSRMRTQTAEIIVQQREAYREGRRLGEEVMRRVIAIETRTLDDKASEAVETAKQRAETYLESLEEKEERVVSAERKMEKLWRQQEAKFIDGEKEAPPSKETERNIRAQSRLQSYMREGVLWDQFQRRQMEELIELLEDGVEKTRVVQKLRDQNEELRKRADELESELPPDDK